MGFPAKQKEMERAGELLNLRLVVKYFLNRNEYNLEEGPR